MKESSSVPDQPGFHALLDAIGGFGAVVTVGIIAVLSVCAAFFIYRSFRGQNGGENNAKETTVATGERRKRERHHRPTESTGECQDGKQKKHCSESSNPSNTDNLSFPTETTEKDLNEGTLKDLEEITDELLTDLDNEMGDKTSDSDLDQCVETDPDENTECEDQIQHEDDDSGRELLADVTRLDCQPEEIEEYLDKSETGQSVDTDEPSETESAQELIYQRHQDHVIDSDQSTDSSNPSKSQLEEADKMLTGKEASKKFEEHHDWRFPRTNNFDCCCNDKKMDIMEKMKGQPWFHSGSYISDTLGTMVNHCNKFDFHNYLGFQTDNTFIGGSSMQVSLLQEKKSDEAVDKIRDKNEISIMDAIMDNNEWLNVGAPEFKDLPWLKPTTEEKREKEGQAKAGLSKEDEELANKRVATVPPLSQMVNVTFRIHYITYSGSQQMAVTGSLRELGAWESFVPLQRAKDGFWANTVPLPAESQAEWKFVLVEDGNISRWEECENRSLFLTSQDEEVCFDKCWGCC